MKPYVLQPLAHKRTMLTVDRFYGQDCGNLRAGRLTASDNMRVLAGGALQSLPVETAIPIAPSAPLAGVYTLCAEYDASYETKVTAEWVYANVCPADVLAYEKNMGSTSRILIADVGMPGKQNGGYRHPIAVFSDADATYVLYDAVYNLIDQRRSEEYSKVGSGTVVQFNSASSSTTTAGTFVCTLTQLWLDRIEPCGAVTSSMVTAVLQKHETVASTLCKATLVRESGKEFRYITSGYLPNLGASYTGSPDAIYERVYPTLATDYASRSAWEGELRRAVRYNNRTAGEGEFGAVGEKLLLLPDGQLLVRESGGWRLVAASESIPKMDAAVQHFDRLFGIAGDRLYASAAGNCTVYTPPADEADVYAAWEAVTPSIGGFTAVVSFDGAVVAFTASEMMTVRGGTLPFSLSHEGAYGCPHRDAVLPLGGWLYFVSGADILRYNGSRVESIGQGLPKDAWQLDASLSAAGGMVVLRFASAEGIYLFDPHSESWSFRRCASVTLFGEELLFRERNGVLVPCRVFGEAGDFGAAVSLGAIPPWRVYAVTVTAKLQPTATLTVADAQGRALLRLRDTDGETVTRTAVFPPNANGAALTLYGSGEVTVYGMRVQIAGKEKL